jgi:hypothetical protein
MKKTKYEILRFKVNDTLYIIESTNLFLIATIAFLAGGVLLTLIHFSAALCDRREMVELTDDLVTGLDPPRPCS